jgi:hypothetical protein
MFPLLARLETFELRHLDWTKAQITRRFCDHLKSKLPSIAQLVLNRVIFPNQRNAERFILAFPGL